MSDPIRTKRRGEERKGERKKVEWKKGGEEERGGENSEKGERGDEVIPPPGHYRGRGVNGTQWISQT